MIHIKSPFKKLHISFMKITDEGKIVGILGTLIIHLIAGIIFMAFRIDTMKKSMSGKYEIEFVAVPDNKQDEKKIELPQSVEQLFKNDEEMLNIARNLASKNEATVDPSEYVDKVKEELIKSGQLGADNFIDEQKKMKENADENISLNDKPSGNESDQPKESQEMAANYKGPTRIYYELSGRNHTYLPIPIYKCPGAGRVTLSIEVNQKGFVEKAEVIKEQSTTPDGCLIETAINSALISRFNPDANSPKVQRGTLTYHFVAQ